MSKSFRKKIIFVLIDGIGDVSYDKYKGKTPCEFAETPNLDSLSEDGICGLMDPFSLGFSCGSDTAHMSMFGYNPLEFYAGRGCFECMGAGLNLEGGDIGFKSNFASMNLKNGLVEKRRADRNFEKEGPVLCKYLDKCVVKGCENYEVTLKYATEHRCGVRIRGKNLSNKISGTDPLKDGLKLEKCVPTVEKGHKEYQNALNTSMIINAVSKHLSSMLMKHEINKEREKNGKNIANVILFRGCGTRLKVPTFQEKHGMKGFFIAPTCIISGFGLSIGCDVIKVKGATGDVHTNFTAKGKACVENIKKGKYDFCFLHIKCVDDCSHDGEKDNKVKYIEKSDKMIGEILEALKNENERYVIAVCGDHSTPCSMKDHSYEPVPFLIAEVNKKPNYSDGVKKFGESECCNGYLGRFPGEELFKVLKAF